MYAFKNVGWDLGRWIYAAAYFVEACILSEWMKRAGVRHVHVHFVNPASKVAMIAGRLGLTGVSLTIHGPDVFYDVSANELAEKIKEAKFVICISSYARSQVMLHAGAQDSSKFIICPLGVETKKYMGSADGPNPIPEVLCVGRLVAAKGQRILIEAFSRLLESGVRARLKIVGDGPDRRTLEDFASQRGIRSSVVFTGSANEDEVRGYYQQADIFALLSFAEGVPVVLMEAMASGLPVVTTRITGIPELVREGEDGLLVAPSDVRGAELALRDVIGDQNLRRRLADSGRARVGDLYELDSNVRRLSDVFSQRLTCSS
jgi:glycosyltransferase involved in cell wall biosynthesis